MRTFCTKPHLSWFSTGVMPGTSGTSSSDSGSRHVCPTGAYCRRQQHAHGEHSPPSLQQFQLAATIHRC